MKKFMFALMLMTTLTSYAQTPVEHEANYKKYTDFINQQISNPVYAPCKNPKKLTREQVDMCIKHDELILKAIAEAERMDRAYKEKK